MRRYWQQLAGWVLAVTTLLVATAGRSSPPGRYTVDVFTVEEGLPQSSVFSMAQSHDGYLWLGTLGGLARFDGANFVVFDEGNTPGLDSSAVIRVYEDKRTNLWVATDSGGLLRIDATGKTANSQSSPGVVNSPARVLSFAEDRSGGVWIYRADGQLACYTDQMRVYTVDGSVRRSRALAPEQSGLLWLTADSSLIAIGPVPLQGPGLPVAHQGSGRVDYLASSRGPGHWRMADGEVGYWVKDKMVRRLGPYPWRSGVFVSAACEDAKGDLIVGTYGDPGDGVYWFGKDGQATQLKGLSHSSIFSLLLDHEGSLWIGTDGGGLNRVRPQAFSVLGTSEGSTVQTVCTDGQRGLWVGYNGARIDYWTPDGVTQFNVPLPNINLGVRSVYRDRLGGVWAGVHGGGLFRFDGKAFVPVNDYAEVANPLVNVILQTKDGTLWVGSHGGLAYLKGDYWRTFSILDGLSGSIARCIAEGPDGALWVGTDGQGLNRIRGREVTVYRQKDGLIADRVLAVHVDGTGEVWAGTTGGLSLLREGKWTSFTAKEGLSGNSIRYLLDDQEGNLWLGSNAGLMRVRKSTLIAYAQGRTNSIAVRSFGKADGLPTRECTQGSQPAATKDSEGRMWFATIKGLAGVANREIVANTNPPPVVMENIVVDGASLATNALRSHLPSSIRLPASSESLEFHFAALNLSAPQKTRFQFRLAGHENAWTELRGEKGLARYARLPAADYTFQVMAGNEDGAWNSQGISVALTVLPPFWKTWWFLITITLAALGIIVGTVHYISTQRLQRQLEALRQKEALEHERARIARDLHDQLGANLTQVALLGELAEEDKELPAEVESHARQISQTARDTTRALDEIVWTVNPANDTLEGLINYICKYAQEYLELAGLKYRMDVPADLPAMAITPELRHNAFLVAKEAINNVVKHAGAQQVWLKLVLQPGRFTLEVEDDGAGLPADAERKGRNGLKNMRSRMVEAGGSFVVTPRPGGGTVARLEAPLRAVEQKV